MGSNHFCCIKFNVTVEFQGGAVQNLEAKIDSCLSQLVVMGRRKLWPDCHGYETRDKKVGVLPGSRPMIAAGHFVEMSGSSDAGLQLIKRLQVSTQMCLVRLGQFESFKRCWLMDWKLVLPHRQGSLVLDRRKAVEISPDVEKESIEHGCKICDLRTLGSKQRRSHARLRQPEDQINVIQASKNDTAGTGIQEESFYLPFISCLIPTPFWRFSLTLLK